MREAVICSPVRTPVGRFGGMLRDVSVEKLGSLVIEAVVGRSGIDVNAIDECVMGQSYPNAEAPATGRFLALAAGLPVEVTGIQVDRRCGSGLQAICTAAMEVQTGVADVVIAGGVESMSQVEFYSSAMRWGPNRGGVQLIDRLDRGRVTTGSSRYIVEGGMIETAENLRREYRISREEQDAYALRSHQRAIAAMDSGRFEKELVGVPVTDRKGNTVVHSQDEHPRRETTLEALAALRPVRAKVDPESTVTAGNASGENDGAAACIVTTNERAEELGLRPMAKLRSWAVAGVHPAVMGIGPVGASKKALDRAGLSLADMGLIELNEAFSAQVLACTREWGFQEQDFDRLNVNGSGISLGHPIAATGARILATLLHEMERRGVEFGMETMCIGGGQGIAAVFQAC
ncbi:MAG: acetyl-CoA C-acetyltransferase [Dehalococcoidia bacterium]|nr:acetyl-CoA C-acetyltransferase [Dehalococcoidia bacterium]